MRAPAATTYLYGNPVVVLGLTGLTAFLGYAWLAEGASWLPAVALSFVTAGSYRAANRLTTFRRWKAEWDAMGGQTAKPFQIPKVLSYLFAGAVWLVTALATSTMVDEPGAALPVLIFWVGSIIAAVVGWRKLADRRAAQASKAQPVVHVMLAAPRGGNSVREAYNALPEYCAQIFIITK